MRSSMDLSRYTGIGQFGPAYETMLRRDAHAPGSVDRVLLERMVRLCRETVGYLYAQHTPTGLAYAAGSSPALEAHAADAVGDSGCEDERVAGIARFCSRLGQRAPQDLDCMVLGGTEEEIIRRGSDWCTDVARAACALYQVAGHPCRLVFLADTENAYSGHVIVEVCRSGLWGAVDSSTVVVYRRADGMPATTWNLMNDRDLVESHGPAAYTSPGQFRAAAVSNYFVWERGAYDYAVSGASD